MPKYPPSPNATKPSQFRLPPETLADLELIADRYRLGSKAAAIRFAAGKEADSLRGGPPKKISKKSRKTD